MADFFNFENNFNQNFELESREFKVGKKAIHLYYIDCLIDKPLFSASVLNAVTSANSISEKEKIGEN